MELTSEVHERIVWAIEMGAYPHKAARRVGVPYNTYLAWIERGEQAPTKRDLHVMPMADLRLLAKTGGVRLNGHRSKRDIADAVYSDSGKYREFAEDVECAYADAECSASESMRHAWERGDWRAAEAYLKRRHPTRWGQTDQVLLRGQIEHHRTSAPEGPDTFAELGVSAEQVEVMGRLLAQAGSNRLPAPIDSGPSAVQHDADSDGGDR